jgi:hypothetical protein
MTSAARGSLTVDETITTVTASLTRSAHDDVRPDPGRWRRRHLVAMSQPAALADQLEAYRAEVTSPV